MEVTISAEVDQVRQFTGELGSYVPGYYMVGLDLLGVSAATTLPAGQLHVPFLRGPPGALSIEPVPCDLPEFHSDSITRARWIRAALLKSSAGPS